MEAKMSISQKDIKLLWGRAANRCAIPTCRIKLTQNKDTKSESIVLGEQAHIVAEEPKGARGKSILSTEERNSYYNLILLCPTHHTMIDNNPEDYPVEKLHLIKAQHELWVDETLSETQDLRKAAHNNIYTSLIDAAVEDCRLSDWDFWSENALHLNARWHKDDPSRIFKFRQKIMKAAWPSTLPELERALNTLSIAINEAVQTFLKHSKQSRDGQYYETDQFYRIDHYDESRYDKLLSEYNSWVNECDNYMYHVAKAANWFSDIVRKDINPNFFAVKGKFLITYMNGLEVISLLKEYNQQEKDSMPQSLTDYISSSKKKGRP
jgi:hypothetical protein